MQAILPALQAVFPTLVGGGATAAGAGATATAGASFWTNAATIVGLGSSIYGALYQRSVLKNAAAVAEDNASRARFASQVSAQDSDVEAAAAIAKDQSARSFSGFAADSGTYTRIDARNRVLARRDALRIRQGGDLEASQYKADAAAKSAEAKGLGVATFFNVLGAGIDIKTNLISDASLVSKRKANQINRITAG